MCGNLPVNIAEREGPHTVAGDCAFAITIAPCAFNLSRFGVFTCGFPPKTPTQSFKSSTAMNKTFGLSELCPKTVVELKRIIRKRGIILKCIIYELKIFIF